jgi:hypothetical protein
MNRWARKRCFLLLDGVLTYICLYPYFLRRRRETCEPVENFARFEQDLHRLFVMAEREALGYELARCDLDVPQVEVEGERYDRVVRCETTYTSAAGPVRVARSLYRSPSGGRAICPLERRAGMIEGSWTPLGAKQATWAVAHVTPKESAELFELIGNMTPSKSTLDRFPKALSIHQHPGSRFEGLGMKGLGWWVRGRGGWVHISPCSVPWLYRMGG